MCYRKLEKKIFHLRDILIFSISFLFATRLLELCSKKYQPWQAILDRNENHGALILGRLPLHKDVLAMKSQFEHLHLIVSCVNAYEASGLPPFILPAHNDEYEQAKLQRLQIPLKDFSAEISYEQISATLKVIHKVLQSKHDVYVHCKAGRGRGWLVVMCYLISYQGFAITDATQLVRKKRTQVNPSKTQIDFVQQFSCYQRTKNV